MFVISALGAALSGALLSYSLATASPTNIGFDVLTFSATAALIGGVSLSGGKGGAIGIAAGVLSLSVLQEILAIVRSPDYVSSLITGGLLVVVTIVWAPDLAQWFRTTRVAGAGRRIGPRYANLDRESEVTHVEQIRLDPDPLEPYLLSQGFRVGDLVFVSGQAALDEHGNVVGVGRLRRAGRADIPQPLARARGRRVEPRPSREGHDLPHRHGELREGRRAAAALVHAALPGRHDRRGQRRSRLPELELEIEAIATAG